MAGVSPNARSHSPNVSLFDGAAPQQLHDKRHNELFGDGGRRFVHRALMPRSGQHANLEIHHGMIGVGFVTVLHELGAGPEHARTLASIQHEALAIKG